MNEKRILQRLNIETKKWVESIQDEELKDKVRSNVVIAGGAITSLLEGETPNDYDVYIKDFDVLVELANYYAELWNKDGRHKSKVTIQVDVPEPDGDVETSKVICFITSKGVASDKEEEEEVTKASAGTEANIEVAEDEVADYRPVFFTDNAISLKGKIQLVLRFWGEPEKVISSFDYVHCTNYFDRGNQDLHISKDALMSILNKQLKYVGSQFPICSLFRMRKYMERGYTISAGEILKMSFQISNLDLTDITVLREQLIGVDTTYMIDLVDRLEQAQEDNVDIDYTYVVNLIDEIF